MARRSNYQVLDKQKANPFGTGPMARSGNKQVMYRVGSPTLGVLADDLVVEWENRTS